MKIDQEARLIVRLTPDELNREYGAKLELSPATASALISALKAKLDELRA